MLTGSPPTVSSTGIIIFRYGVFVRSPPCLRLRFRYGGRFLFMSAREYLPEPL